MATITIQITAGQTFTHTRTISAAHLVRLLNAYRTILDLSGATDAQIAQAWAEGVFNGTLANVRGAEKDAAKVAAEIAVTDIVLA